MISPTWPPVRSRGDAILTLLLVFAGWTGVSLVAALPIARRIAFHERPLAERCGLATVR
jgi:hypothetical protein